MKYTGRELVCAFAVSHTIINTSRKRQVTERQGCVFFNCNKLLVCPRHTRIMPWQTSTTKPEKGCLNGEHVSSLQAESVSVLFVF